VDVYIRRIETDITYKDRKHFCCDELYDSAYLYLDVTVACWYAEEQVQEVLTADEKQKLYDAIGYEENVATDLPKEVCCMLYFSIKTVLLCDAVLLFYIL